jgi:hypothetical protein
MGRGSEGMESASKRDGFCVLVWRLIRSINRPRVGPVSGGVTWPQHGPCRSISTHTQLEVHTFCRVMAAHVDHYSYRGT